MHLYSLPLDMLQFVILCPSLGKPELSIVLKIQYHKYQVEAVSNLLWPFSRFLSNKVAKGTLLAQIHLAINQDTQVLFCKTVFCPAAPQPLLAHGIIPICLCLISQRFPSANFSSLLRAYWMVSLLTHTHVWYCLGIWKECTASHHPDQQQEKILAPELNPEKCYSQLTTSGTSNCWPQAIEPSSLARFPDNLTCPIWLQECYGSMSMCYLQHLAEVRQNDTELLVSAEMVIMLVMCDLSLINSCLVMPLFFKDVRERLCNVVGELPLHPWMHPIQSSIPSLTMWSLIILFISMGSASFFQALHLSTGTREP